jgi:Protein phosphatase 2C
MNTVKIAGGSVIGREHRRVGRNNQDALAWRRGPGGAVAVVCDGCSAGRRSEVGAALGARLWCRKLGERLEAGGALDDRALWLDVRDAVLAALGGVAAALGGDLAEVVHEHFLFTSVVAAWTEAHAAVFAIGDGVVGFDGETRALGPFPDNQPPYLGYGLLGPAPAPTVLEVRPAGAVEAILIASDGAARFGEDGARDAAGEPLGPLAQLVSGDRWFRNPDAIRRRLAVANREDTWFDPARGTIARRGAPLDDDTTIVVLRRAPRTTDTAIPRHDRRPGGSGGTP